MSTGACKTGDRRCLYRAQPRCGGLLLIIFEHARRFAFKAFGACDAAAVQCVVCWDFGDATWHGATCDVLHRMAAFAGI